MTSIRGVLAASVALIAALGATNAHADGGCSKGWRDVTAGERATMMAVVDTAKKALPPAPEGWVVRGEDSVTMPTTLCIDHEAAPWTYEISRSYYHAAVQDARNEVITSAAADMAAQMEAKPRVEGGFQAVSPANASPPAAQVIAVAVTADESRLTSTLDAIDFAALASTVAR